MKNTAQALAALGEHDEALSLLDRSRSLLNQLEMPDMAVRVALLRAELLLDLDDLEGAAKAFEEAHHAAFIWARSQVDVERYRRGYHEAWRAHPRCRPAVGDLVGAEALITSDIATHVTERMAAGRAARADGDLRTALRYEIYAASVLAELGQIDEAVKGSWAVIRDAGARGLAFPEAEAWEVLASLQAAGADTRLPVDALGARALSAVLMQVHEEVVDELGLDLPDRELEVGDTGWPDNNLGNEALRFHSLELAGRHLTRAVQLARQSGEHRRLANRLANLLPVLDQLGANTSAVEVAAELESLLDPVWPATLGIRVYRALGEHASHVDRGQAIQFLVTAVDLVEGLRHYLPAGVARSELVYTTGVHRLLARLLREEGHIPQSFDVLQAAKGRRNADTRSAASADISDDPTTATELQATVTQSSVGNLVDLLVEEDGIVAYVIGPSDIQAVRAEGDTKRLLRVERGDIREREFRLVRAAMQDPLLVSLVARIADIIPAGDPLVLVPDERLPNIPLHIVPRNGQPWGDKNRIAYLSSAPMLRLAKSRHRSDGRSLVAGDSSTRYPLPYAARECEAVATLLEVEALVGPDRCSRAAIEAALRQGDLDVVHLAVHGRGDPRRGGRASLLLGDEDWVVFDELARLPWAAELVVFSGCSTAVLGRRHNRELLGVAAAAAASGATAVLACLWPVGDRSAAIFMEAFYGWFAPRRHLPELDLRQGMEVAQRALRADIAEQRVTGRRRDGRDLSVEAPPYIDAADSSVVAAADWAPFILVGRPVLHRTR
jgi:CHAT domain-containing protein/tetratricopeptide (TPR) repeat protein